MIDKIIELKLQFDERFQAAQSLDDLDTLKAEYIGKKGYLTNLLKEIKDLSPEQRISAGQSGNQVKHEITDALNRKRITLDSAQRDERIDSEWIDVSLNYSRSRLGALHPVSRIQYEIEDIFTSMGFTVLDGPHIETEFYNFEALNIPPDHPARDMQDTFYFTNGSLLRTHTSTIQVRGMEKIKPPFKIIGPGKVFRVERVDASHEAAFHQLEGMVVAKDITVAHLIFTMKTLLSEIFKDDVNVRLRPGYFPFVEPGFELDISCLICRAKGCSVCRQSGWLELMPCGMVHPNVLESGGIDHLAYSGFAFGLGLDRLVMMRYKIEDIRHMHSGDLRFSGQFI